MEQNHTGLTMVSLPAPFPSPAPSPQHSGLGPHHQVPDAGHHAAKSTGPVRPGRHPRAPDRLFAHAGKRASSWAGGGRRGCCDAGKAASCTQCTSKLLLGPCPCRRRCCLQVYGADEAFVTGTFAGQIPVREVDGRGIGPSGRGTGRGPMVLRLQRLYQELCDAAAAAGRTPVAECWQG